MTISLERALRHMAWANQKVYSAVETLPEEALKSYIINPEWTAYEILFHTCESAGFYVYRLGIGERPSKIDEPAKISTLKLLIAQHDKNLISAVEQQDREIEIQRDGKTIRRWASTILTQSVHHATEHRAQLIDALEFKGYKPINLDDIDQWGFDEFEKQSKTLPKS